MTSSARIQLQRELDLEALSRDEEKKTRLLKEGDANRIALEQQYALNRAAINKQADAQLQALKNSQGWQGVFGSQFASLLRNDEAAMKRWAESSNQAADMVRLSLTALKTVAQDAFGQMAQGMGQGIADAIVYSKSIGEAMRAAAAATLESIAAQSFVQAIYALALGFLRLAEHDPVGAGSAFTSAAIFGGIGAAAAVAGRLIAPPQAGAATASAGGGNGSAGSSAAGDSGAGSAAPAGPQIQIVIQGNAYTVDPLMDAINEAVMQRDKQLTATNTTTGAVVRR